MLNLETVKRFLHIDYDDEDEDIEELIDVAKEYLGDYIGKPIEDIMKKKKSKLLLKVLINEWYKDRGLMLDKKVNEKTRYTLESIKQQLKYDGDDENAQM